MNKHQRYREKCISEGRCPHCGKPCAPFHECYERRFYKRFWTALDKAIKEGRVTQSENYYYINAHYFMETEIRAALVLSAISCGSTLKEQAEKHNISQAVLSTQTKWLLKKVLEGFHPLDLKDFLGSENPTVKDIKKNPEFIRIPLEGHVMPEWTGTKWYITKSHDV